MAKVPFSKLTGTTLGEALRESIREQREAAMPDVTTAEGQLARARQRGARIVTIKATGQQGWVVQELNYGFTLRVRIAGAKAPDAIKRVKIDEISE